MNETYKGIVFKKNEASMKNHLEQRIETLEFIERGLENLLGFLQTEIDSYCENYMGKYLRG
ncbi:hypothetical protein CN674_22095 [Bacillus toyonensis]|nr:hypothetical protein CN674_22095 [Bacillus toyonensis]